ncbi:MAG: BON domain-containing protein [Cyanobacteria bacterium NC_groundwater_1444_Ag_S-0.65um_54_12]|nr:BON domain-containing protein [Cyanobacteria bacterium NC_groundwater_1444_Ag_S-0.65um_54_12]
MALVTTDETIQQDIMEELRFDPEVRAPEIGVRVKDGIVSLMGFVDSYMKRLAAEKAAMRVTGVRGIANEIEVRILGAAERTDEDIVRDATHALELNASIPANRLKVMVDKGWVKLEGDVDWSFQRMAAENAVRYLQGVRGISNLIIVKAQPLPGEVKQRIKAAFVRDARLDANNVMVEVSEHRITLRGTVRSYAEKNEAGRIAWSIPGVTAVDNLIAVSSY